MSTALRPFHLAFPVTDLNEALPRADFVSIHCPKTTETVAMFNKDRLARMKPTAYIVNTARGGIIEEADLYQALVDKKLAGAGLDVFAEEPIDLDDLQPHLDLDRQVLVDVAVGVLLADLVGRAGSSVGIRLGRVKSAPYQRKMRDSSSVPATSLRTAPPEARNVPI